MEGLYPYCQKLIRQYRRVVGHLGQSDPVDPGRPGLFFSIPDAPVEYRCRRSILPGRLGCQHDRPAACTTRRSAQVVIYHGNVRVRVFIWGSLGIYPWTA